MIRNRESVADTAERIKKIRPVLEPMIKSFEPIFSARATLPVTLVPLVEKCKLRLPNFTEEYYTNGRSLLSNMPLEGFETVLNGAAKVMLPLLAKLEYLKPFIPSIKKYFADSAKKITAKTKPENIPNYPHKSYKLAEAYIANDAKIVEELAKDLQVPDQALLFVFHFILAPSIQALAMVSFPTLATDAELDEENVTKKQTPPWDANANWKEGYCPVCGSFPSISYLDRALVDENNQFLSGGGGRKYLHCSLCGINWHFKRGTCPACKEEGPDAIEIIKEAKNEYDERIDWCTKCKSYCPNIDLRVRGVRPNFDMMALGMMHLDIIAAEKKLLPLSPAFWNVF